MERNILKPVVYITVGLPGSGKTTWAKKYIDKSKNRIVRINKDDIRAMLSGPYSVEKEALVESMELEFLIRSLQFGYSVIIDDTNLSRKNITTILNAIKESNVDIGKVRYKDLTHVNIYTCIARDARREKSVGSKVIRRMEEHSDIIGEEKLW